MNSYFEHSLPNINYLRVFFCSFKKRSFTQAIYQLINNAVESLQSEDNKVITLALWNNDGNDYLQVYDSGTPINNKIINKIFEPFFTTKDKSESAGLGLSITTKLLKESDMAIFYKEKNNHPCFNIKLN